MDPGPRSNRTWESDSKRSEPSTQPMGLTIPSNRPQMEIQRPRAASDLFRSHPTELPPLRQTFNARSQPHNPNIPRLQVSSGGQPLSRRFTIVPNEHLEEGLQNKRRRLSSLANSEYSSQSAYAVRPTGGGPRPVIGSGAAVSSPIGDTRKPLARGLSYQRSPSLQGFAPDPYQPPATDENCCRIRCTGDRCSQLSFIVQEVVNEFCSLDSRLRGALNTERQPSEPVPDIDQHGPSAVLGWVLDSLRWDNAAIQGLSGNYSTSTISSSTCSAPYPPNSTADSPGTRREPRPMGRSASQMPLSPNIASPEAWKGGHPSDPSTPHQIPLSASLQTSAPPSFYAPQSVRLLPSPSLSNFTTPSFLPPRSPSSTSSLPSAVHTAHLQDLQHQVSVKILALSTLQREHDTLLQKLERQRIKCSSLEKKYEVADVEIGGLNDERERLQLHVESLEKQVEELQQSRDEAREQLSLSGNQYMKIMQMAGEIGAKSVEEKKAWAAEKETFEERIKSLEAGGRALSPPTALKGCDISTASASELPHRQARSDVQGITPVAAKLETQPSTSAPEPSAETESPRTGDTDALRDEVATLRARNRKLEATLKALGEELRSFERVAEAVTATQSNMEALVHKVSLAGSGAAS